MYEIARGWSGRWKVYHVDHIGGERSWIGTFPTKTMASIYVGLLQMKKSGAAE
jgi:hypothetical protein